MNEPLFPLLHWLTGLLICLSFGFGLFLEAGMEAQALVIDIGTATVRHAYVTEMT